MAIDRLNSTAALIVALREDIIARGAAQQRTERAAHSPVQAAGARNAPSMAQLRSQLVGIACGVDLSEPVAVRQARTRFIRAILLWEFGPELREHPDWQPLSESIDHALGGHAAGAEAFVKLLAQLQSETEK